MSCPFCGSPQVMIDTPFVDRVTGEKEQTYCCIYSKRNSKNAARKYDPSRGSVPSLEESSEW